MSTVSELKLVTHRIPRWLVKLEIVTYLAIARFLILYVRFDWWRARLGLVVNQPKNSAVDVPLTPLQRETGVVLGRYVRQMARRVPFKAVCLPQALAARWALNRRNIQTELYIGARKGPAETPMDLHAWLMLGDECLTGARERNEFIAFSRQADTDMV